MRRLVAVVATLTIASCAAAPTAPLPVTTEVSDSVPARLTLDVQLGKAEQAGHATVTVRVLSVLNKPLTGIDVVFATDVGTFAPAHTPTDVDGYASSALTASQAANVLVTAGTTSTKTIVVALPPIVTPVQPPITPAPPVPTPPPPTPAPAPAPAFTVVLTAAPNSLVVGSNSTLTAVVTPLHGAGPATVYDWDCNNDGLIEMTTNLNAFVCNYGTVGAIISKVTARNGTATGFGTTTVTVAVAAPLTVAITATSYAPAIGASDDFTATVTSSGPVPLTLQWEWDTNGDSVYDVTPPPAASPNTQTIVFGTIGAHTVKVRVTDTATGRTAIGTVQITVP